MSNHLLAHENNFVLLKTFRRGRHSFQEELMFVKLIRNMNDTSTLPLRVDVFQAFETEDEMPLTIRSSISEAVILWVEFKIFYVWWFFVASSE